MISFAWLFAGAVAGATFVGILLKRAFARQIALPGADAECVRCHKDFRNPTDVAVQPICPSCVMAEDTAE